MTWLKDENGNQCSVEYFGSQETAQAALNSLKDCKNCINCSDCSRCSDCSGCSRCSDCSDCSRCSRCSDCSRCSGCSDCSGCSGCSGCSDCSDCSDLKDASPVEGTAEPIKVPVIPNIHKAVYEAASNPKALDMSRWHTCKNTHCRAGWVVTLAGEEGRKLESKFDTLTAAMRIYDASDPNFKISPCRFFDTNEAALADMKRLADGEGKL